jgi:hypothetical protein
MNMTSVPRGIPISAANASTASSNRNSATTGANSDSFLIPSDDSLLEYVTGTTSLNAALRNPHAKVLANEISYGREHGYAQGDYTEYIGGNLTASDAKMFESMTGTTNIVDATATGSQDIGSLETDVALDRQDGSLSGNLTPGYINNIISFQEKQLEGPGNAGLIIGAATLDQALAYLKGVGATSSTEQAALTYEVSA